MDKPMSEQELYQIALDVCTPGQIAALEESDTDTKLRRIATEQAEHVVSRAIFWLALMGAAFWWLRS